MLFQPVIGFLQVYFYCHIPCLPFLQTYGVNEFLCYDHIINLHSSRNKGGLERECEVKEIRPQSLNYHFCDNLINSVARANRAEGTQIINPRKFRDESDEGFIQVVWHGTTSEDLLYFFKDRTPHNIPIRLEETNVQPVRSRNFKRLQTPKTILNFLNINLPRHLIRLLW